MRFKASDNYCLLPSVFCNGNNLVEKIYLDLWQNQFMRKIYALLLVLCAGLPGFVMAQQTLTTDILPALGTSLTYENGASCDPGNPGANQTWDLTGLLATDTVSSGLLYEAPSGTPYAANFPGNNLVFNFHNGATYEYFKTTTSVLQLGGINSNTVNITYQDDEDFMRFPFNYNDSFTDPFQATFVNGGLNFVRSGNVTVVADGYGKLMLPNRTIFNVMRVHFHEVYQDSTSFQGVANIIYYDNDEYMWYATGFPLILASTYTFTNNGQTTEESQYAKSIANGVNDVAADEDFKLFPVPAVNRIQVLPGQREGLNKLEILDISGRQLALQGADAIKQSTISLDLSAYQPGAYFVRLTYNNGNEVTKRFIVQ